MTRYIIGGSQERGRTRMVVVFTETHTCTAGIAGVLGLIVPRKECPPCILIVHTIHNNTIQVYYVNVMTNVIELKGDNLSRAHNSLLHRVHVCPKQTKQVFR